MAYSNLWTTNHPVSGNNLAKDLDDAIRRARLDVIERILSVVGPSAIATDDPICPTTRNTEALKTLVDTKPTINTTDNLIPVRTGVGVLGDSSWSQATAGLMTLLTGRALNLVDKYYGVYQLNSTTLTNGVYVKIPLQALAIPQQAGVSIDGANNRILVNKAGLYAMFASLQFTGGIGAIVNMRFARFGGGGVFSPAGPIIAKPTATYDMPIFAAWVDVATLNTDTYEVQCLASSVGINIQSGENYFGLVRLG